jgi:hypothetical protein
MLIIAHFTISANIYAPKSQDSLSSFSNNEYRDLYFFVHYALGDTAENRNRVVVAVFVAASVAASHEVVVLAADPLQ